MVTTRASVAAALRSGNRAAVEALARNLAAEVDTVTSQRDLVPVVRAFLAAVAQLEAMDAAAQRRARRDAEKLPQDDHETPNALDELLAQREKRRGRAVR